MKKLYQRPHNPVTRSPLLRKGGVHQRCQSGLRAEAKRKLANDLNFWLEDTDEYLKITNNNFPEKTGKDFAFGLAGIIYRPGK